MKRAGSGGNSSQSSTSDSEEDFLLDMWDDWMGSDFICHVNHVLPNWRNFY